jgi:hypothetical protein
LDDNTVICINETWLDDSDLDSNWVIDKEHLEIFRLDRNKVLTGKKKGGGSLILCPRKLKPKRRPDLELSMHNIESVWIEISAGNTKILINALYNPCENKFAHFDDFMNKNIDQAIVENKPTIILGDINQNILDQPTMEKITNIITPYGFNLCNRTEATRIQGDSQSLIDITMTDIGNAYLTTVSDTPINTDHLMTTTVFPIKTNKNSTARKITTLDKSQYTKEEFNRDLSRKNFNSIYQVDCPQEAYSRFERILGSTLHKHAPVTRKYVKPKPFTAVQRNNEELRKLAELKKRAYADYKGQSTVQSFEAYKASRNKYNNALKRTKIKANMLKYTQLNSDQKRWKYINNMRQSQNDAQQINELRNSLGDLVTENAKKAELFNYKFVTLGDYNGTVIPYNLKPTRRGETFHFRFITTAETCKYIKQLDNSKPMGPSTIPAWAIKDAEVILTPHICYLINLAISQRVFPNQLKLADVTPIFKKGNKEDPTNYRPISITCPISKIYERALCTQITEFLERNRILSGTQFGFQKSKSSTDAISYLVEAIRKELDSGNIASAAFIDLSKAFDSLDHEILQHKLTEIGFSLHAAQLIQSYLSNRKQRVNVNGCFSTWYETYQGVPQGTILGPILFLIYVYDLQASTGIGNICQYADDTTIYVTGRNATDNALELERCCEKLLRYFEAHRLKVNVSKTEYVIFSRKGTGPMETPLKVGEQSISPTKTAKYLGIHLDAHLTFEKQVNVILQKMAMGIKTIYAIRDFLPLTSRLMLFNSLVIPHMTYAAPLLAGLLQKHIKSLDSQLSWGIKACCNLSSYTPSLCLKKRHKILPAKFMIQQSVLLYFHKIIKGHTNSFKIVEFPTKHRSSPRGSLALDIPRIKTNYLKHCLTKQGCELMNKLPYDIKSLESHCYFKKQVKLHFLGLLANCTHESLNYT